MDGKRDISDFESTLAVLRKVLTSRTFAGAPRMVKLLRFCVEETLAGRRQSQRAIAKVLEYEQFDATHDSNVRREIGRLRYKLRDYYDHEGATDDIVFSIPRPSSKSGYSVEVRPRQPVSFESQNPRYLQLICEARHLWGQRAPESILEAIRLYEEAITEDPGHCASAQSGLAECYCFLTLGGFRPHDTMPKAKEWAIKALSSDPNSGAACAARAFVATAYEWNWPLGEQLFQKALQIAPDSIEVHCWYASHLICVGRLPEAVRHARRAQALEHDPTAVVLSHVAKILYVAGDNDRAFDLIQLALQINPRFFFTHWYLGLILLERGDSDIAVEHLAKAVTLAPDSSGAVACLGYGLAVLGDESGGLRCLRTLEDMRQRRYVPATDFATLHAGIGDHDAAFLELARAVEERCLYLTWSRVWPPFKRLHNELRFTTTLERLGLDNSKPPLPVGQRT